MYHLLTELVLGLSKVVAIVNCFSDSLIRALDVLGGGPRELEYRPVLLVLTHEDVVVWHSEVAYGTLRARCPLDSKRRSRASWNWMLLSGMFADLWKLIVPESRCRD